MTPAAIFLNREICLVCTQEGLLGPFRWKMKAFGSASCTAEVLRIYNDSFLMDSFDFRSKRVSEQSQIQFDQSYWVKNDTAQFVSYTSQKNNLP